MHVSLIDFASPAYDEIVQLRTELLRIPLNLEFTVSQLVKEWSDFHLACYDQKDQLLGALILTPIDEKTIKMRQVVVSEPYQKSGIGRLLVNESETFALANNYKEIVLNAREVVVDFYLKLDYRKVGKRFIEVNIPHFKMIKQIKH